MSRLVVSRNRLLLIAAALAVALGVISALLSWPDVALALFGVSGLAAFSWIVLWARSVNDTLQQLGQQIEAVGVAVKKRPRQPQFMRLADAVARLDRQLHQVGHDVRLTRAEVNRVAGTSRAVQQSVLRVPSATAELNRLYDVVVSHDRPMPELGNWAMTPATLVWMVDRIMSSPVETIVECGSGSSTVWLATALEHRGGPGRVVSLESNPQYGAITRSRVDELGLGHRVVIVDAPMRETTLPGRDAQPWYDLSNFPADIISIDILFVDGPIGALAPQVRYPALALFADRLPDGAAVVLDDTVRPDELEIVDLWLADRHSGRRLTVSERLDQAVAFTVAVDV